MPILQVKKPNEVPSRRRTSRAVQEQQEAYEGFIREVDRASVGELALDEGDQIRSTMVRLRYAANRLGVQIDVWDSQGKVYLRSLEGKRRGSASRST
jgi:hypothetical protein